MTDRVKIEAGKVKSGDLMAFVYYGHVDKVRGAREGTVVDVVDVDNGNKFSVHGEQLINDALSADQFSSTKKVTKTAIAEVLVASHNTPFTVSFQKVDGSERVLRGRLVAPEPLMGRSMVEDLDVKHNGKGAPLRQVDHRNINWLIVNGVKYTLKK